MTIIEALKNETSYLRINHGDKWLVWDEIYDAWKVYYHKKGSRYTSVIYEGDSEEKAVEILLSDKIN